MLECIWLIALLVMQSVAPAVVAADSCGREIQSERACAVVASLGSCCDTGEPCCCTAHPAPKEQPKPSDAAAPRPIDLAFTPRCVDAVHRQVALSPRIYAPARAVRGSTVSQMLSFLCVWRT